MKSGPVFKTNAKYVIKIPVIGSGEDIRNHLSTSIPKKEDNVETSLSKFETNDMFEFDFSILNNRIIIKWVLFFVTREQNTLNALSTQATKYTLGDHRECHLNSKQ